MRKDIPQEHFNALIAKASEVVFERLAASNPHAVYEVHKVLTDITGQDPAGQPKARDYREAAAQFDVIRRSGAPVDPVVCEYAKSGKFEETVASLSALSGAPIKLVESVMNDARPDSDFALILAKAAGLSWPTVKHICILRRKVFRISPQAIESARHSFDRLQAATAERLVRFYNERHAALADFHQLEQKHAGKHCARILKSQFRKTWAPTPRAASPESAYD